MRKRKIAGRSADYSDPLPVPAGANGQMCSAWQGERLLDGFASIGRVEAELSKAQDNPQGRREQFQKARLHFKYQLFIRGIILLRYAFYHFGFRVGSEEKKPSTRLVKWEESNRAMYRRYARDTWLEWLVQDNVVGLWRQQGGKPPLVYPPENCKFQDVFGNEVLTIIHNITSEHITTIGGFSRTEQKEFVKTPNEMKLDHKNSVFGFDVLRRERTGAGFGVPAVASAFLPIAEMISLDVASQTLAAACRTVLEQHKMGYEIKSGIHAGSKANHWNTKRSDGFETKTKGKTGHVRVSTNFDHDVVQCANWPDPKHFGEAKFSGAMMRLANWAMPLGQMLLGKNLNPFVLPMLKYQAIAEREYVAEHLRTVFIQALGAPEEIKLVWSNECFSDPRIFADLLKTGLAAGPVSQSSYLEQSGFDPEQERERKSEEAKLPKGQTTPIYDAAHGPPKKAAGKPAGTKNGEGDD